MVGVDAFVTGLIAFIFGGGLVSLIKARGESKMAHAQAANMGAKTVPEVTDLSISTLVKVNAQLTEDYERVSKERDSYFSQLETLRAEVADLRQKLEDAQSATEHLQAKLDDLLSSIQKDGVHG